MRPQEPILFPGWGGSTRRCLYTHNGGCTCVWGVELQESEGGGYGSGARGGPVLLCSLQLLTRELGLAGSHPWKQSHTILQPWVKAQMLTPMSTWTPILKIHKLQ